jgi:predicted ATPase
MKFFVLTGGPCAGKTTALNWLKENFGDRIIFVPEVSSFIFENGLWPPPKPWSYEWQVGLQKLILKYQLQFEAEAIQEAEDHGCQIIVADRGIPDGYGYLDGGSAEFFLRFPVNGLTEKSANDRYEAVFHLRSRAVINPELFLKLQENNPHRFEGEIARSVEIDQRIIAAWDSHPNRIILSGNLEENREVVARELKKYLQKK